MKKKLRSVKAVLMQEFPEKSQDEIEEMMRQLNDVKGEYFIKSNGENITKIGVRYKVDEKTKSEFYFTTKHYDDSMD